MREEEELGVAQAVAAALSFALAVLQTLVQLDQTSEEEEGDEEERRNVGLRDQVHWGQ